MLIDGVNGGKYTSENFRVLLDGNTKITLPEMTWLSPSSTQIFVERLTWNLSAIIPFGNLYTRYFPTSKASKMEIYVGKICEQ